MVLTSVASLFMFYGYTWSDPLEMMVLAKETIKRAQQGNDQRCVCFFRRWLPLYWHTETFHITSQWLLDFPMHFCVVRPLFELIIIINLSASKLIGGLLDVSSPLKFIHMPGKKESFTLEKQSGWRRWKSSLFLDHKWGATLSKQKLPSEIFAKRIRRIIEIFIRIWNRFRNMLKLNRICLNAIQLCYDETSHKLRMPSNLLSDCQSLTLNVMIRVSQFVRNPE